MAYWQEVSPDFQARLEELSGLFRSCRDSFQELSDRYHWTPAEGSPASDDALTLPSPDPKIHSLRGETGHRMIAEVIHSFLVVASGHLGGLAALFASAEVMFSPPVLIRAVIENCAHAVWVLGNDPDEDVDQRLARAYLEELLSAEEEKKNAGRMLTKVHPTFIRAEADYKALKAEILARFPGVTKADLGDRSLLGQKLPKLEDAVVWMYVLTKESGGAIGSDQATGIYGFLSNMTHPTLYSERDKRLWEVEPVSGNRVANLRIGIDFLENEARAALAAFYNALTYVNSYFGWPEDVLKDLEARFDEVIPSFFIDASAHIPEPSKSNSAE
ncbi:hypothetical protein DEJ27_13225 [Curtobacterium sp. MCPF17_018]|uniref:hypothetical protein n=1 Tax=Curtobacterium sp. MCPF17_018 TaxID=2175638 RepID=UPI000DA92B85|nr:hypothetical protein [Curtobacterium sp. MCPF17_018]PZE66842.1 hypothetical protein DEJ27_13225 [Curtobacterium sp. MCPF17_018]